MPYRLRRKDGSVEHALRRIAVEQIERAIHAIDHQDEATAVHQVRRRGKKLRGLIRLVRPCFPDYAAENAAIRDMAAALSHARDAHVMQAVYDGLCDQYADQVDRRALSSIRRRFTHMGKRQAERAPVGGLLAVCRDQLTAAAERTGGWTLTREGWDAVEGGLAKTYGRARRAGRHLPEGAVPDEWHELRKRIKYHWCHVRLLTALWPEAMTARAAEASRLADMLGDHHDLAVFEARLVADSDAFGTTRDVEVMLSLARLRRAALEEQSRPLIARMTARTPGELTHYWRSLWDMAFARQRQ